MTETTRHGRFRVFRVVPAVHHLNLQDVDEPTLYTVHESGYEPPLAGTVDDLATGDLVEATLVGDPEEAEAAWTITDCERIGGVTVDIVTDAAPPSVARELWDGGESVVGAGIGTDAEGAVIGECWVQPRSALPNGAFVPNLVAGVLPLEPWLRELPYAGEPAAELIAIDPDPPLATTFSTPYGVFLFFTDAGRDLADEFRATYDVPRGTDTTPTFDPY